MAASLSEIEALVQLLDDPDEAVQASVRSRLEELGRSALPLLRQVRDHVEAPVQDELDDLVHEIHLDDLTQAWHAVMEAEEVDLERGAFLVALYRFPTLDIPAYQSQLDVFAETIRPRVEEVSGAERALVLAEYVTEDLDFRGNREHYYDPDNSYLNRVIDTRQGIPISLSVIYLCLARRLNLPVCGVNMPVHFLVKYTGTQGEIFLDLFNEGEVVSKERCVRFLLESGIRPRSSYFQRAAPRSILLRIVRNLLAIAEEANRKQTARELSRLMAPWDPHMEWDDENPQP